MREDLQQDQQRLAVKTNTGSFVTATACVKRFRSVALGYCTYLNANLLLVVACNEPERLEGPPLPQAP
jgi:hypothetical protein